MRRTSSFLVLLFVVSAACAESTKESWRETGHSWGEGGRQFLRSLGRSVAGEGEPKEEWKQTGEDFRNAGKNTADSIGESIQPKPETTPTR